MKRIIASVFLSFSLFVCSIPCIAKEKTIDDVLMLDLANGSLDNKNYDYILSDENTLKKALMISDNFDTPVFLKTSNLNFEQLIKSVNLEVNGVTENLTEKHGLDFKGYLIFNSGDNVISWYAEESISDDELFNSVSNQILHIDEKIESQNRSVSWNEVNDYATNVIYTEATVGVSGTLYSSSTSKYGGQQMVVEVNPTASTAYKTYKIVSIQPKISVTNGTVSDYWPDIRSDYSTTLSLSFPWSVSVSFNTNTSVNITKPSGGVGTNYMTWKYSPKSYTKNLIKTKSGITFNSSTTTLKTAIRYDITLFTLDNTTGTNSTRTVNYSTNFSS